MNKNIIVKSLFFVGLTLLAPSTFAQDPGGKVITGKTGTPRTNTVPNVTVDPNNIPVTGTQGVNTPGTDTTTTGTDTNTNTSNTTVPVNGTVGVNGVSGANPNPNTNDANNGTIGTKVLPNVSQVPTNGVNGVSSGNPNGGKSGGKNHGKVVSQTSNGGNTKPSTTVLTNPAPATQTPSTVPVTATSGAGGTSGAATSVAGGTSGAATSVAGGTAGTNGTTTPSTNTPVIMMQDDGRTPVTPVYNPGGTEVQLKKTPGQVDWTQPIGSSAAPSSPNNQKVMVGSSGPTSTTTAVPVVTSVQTSKQDVVPSGESCKDDALSKINQDALQRINQTILHDNKNVLGKMYELTAMRLARKALSTGNNTLEGYARKNISDLEKQIADVKGSEVIQAQIKGIYESYGKSGDLEKINADLDTALKQGQKASYWAKGTHLWNENASSMVLAMSLGDKDSGLTDTDAATIWTVEKIRKAAEADPRYKNGHAVGNMMNISNRVARYLGVIEGGKKSTKADLDKMIGDQEQELVVMMAKAYAQEKETLFACIDTKMGKGTPGYCADCAHKAKEDFEHANLGLDQIQRGLMQEVAKSENVKMEKSLKGKMGDVSFDLSNFAKGKVALQSKPVTTQTRKIAQTTPAPTTQAPAPVVKKKVIERTPNSGRYWKEPETGKNCEQVCPLGASPTACTEGDNAFYDASWCCCKS